ncbi:MAG: hypothetical protein V3R80_01380 [Candidatus Tectomicrobia bacterium]
MLHIEGTAEKRFRVIDDPPGQVPTDRGGRLGNRYTLANEIDVHFLENLDAQTGNVAPIPKITQQLS